MSSATMGATIRTEVRTLGDLTELVAEWGKLQQADTPLRPYIGEAPREFADGVVWVVQDAEDPVIGIFVEAGKP